MIKNAGFGLDAKVAEIVDKGSWKLPADWYQQILLSNALTLQASSTDVLKWRSNDGKLGAFSTAAAWDDLRTHAPLVNWFDIVWYKNCIPKHSFLLWLVFKRKLKTQDLLSLWDTKHNNSLPVSCVFCDSQPDSHAHHFFECSFALKVWDEVNIYAGLDAHLGKWDQIVQNLLPIAKKNSVNSVVSKLLLAGSIYSIWCERNTRLFKQQKNSEVQLVDEIISTVRLKLMTVRLRKNKRTEHALAALARWNLPSSLLIGM